MYAKYCNPDLYYAELLLAQIFFYLMSILGHIKCMCCQDTCKQKISREWIGYLIHHTWSDWACVECIKDLNFSAPNFSTDSLGAENCTFRRVTCSSRRLDQYCGKIYEMKMLGVHIHPRWPYTILKEQNTTTGLLSSVFIS